MHATLDRSTLKCDCGSFLLFKKTRTMRAFSRNNMRVLTPYCRLASSKSPAVATMAPTLSVKSGSGSWVTAKDNKTGEDRVLLDMTCGIGATSTGYCHPKIVAAVKSQVENMVHAQQNIFGEFDQPTFIHIDVVVECV